MSKLIVEGIKCRFRKKIESISEKRHGAKTCFFVIRRNPKSRAKFLNAEKTVFFFVF